MGAIRRRRICGRYTDYRDESADAAVTMLFAAAGERDYRDESADAAVGVELLGRDCGDESADGAVTMLFAAVGVQLLGSETTETNLRTLLLPCYLQPLGCRCWGARRRRRICGRCCYHAICSCWGGAAGERDGGDESADGAVTMLFGAVAELLGSETEETNLRAVLLPCYLQLLGWRCWGARLRRRICGRCCYHAICSCWGGGAGERYGGDESADGAATMLFAAVGVQLLGSETEETNLRTLLLPCYLELLGWSCWGARWRRQICGRCCYHAIWSCWGGAAGERDGGDESADGAVTADAIWSCSGGAAGERDGGDESADAAVTMRFGAVEVEVLGSETEETNLRTVLLPCYLELLGCSCWGAIRRKRICGRCCYHCHAICSCWGAAAGERYGGDETADGAVAVLFAAVGAPLLGSDTEETNLRTLLLPCYLQLLGCSCWGAIRRRRICGRCCYHAICSCWGAAAGERDCGDEFADGAVTMRMGDWGRRRRSCGRWWWSMLLFK